MGSADGTDDHEDVVQSVDDAVVTAYEQGRVPTLHPPGRWMRGAVHTADGDLVRHSQRTWSRDNPNAPVAIDPDALRRTPDIEPLAGTWSYAGHWSRHFGHFLLEVLPTLWSGRSDSTSGLLAHRSFRQPRLRQPRGASLWADLLPWQRDLLDLAGYGDLPVHVVRGRPVRVENLVVPSRPVVFRSTARVAAVGLWQRVATAAGTPTADGAKVFLSRRRFHTGCPTRSTRAWDDHLDRAFAGAGFVVVHPERLDVVDQVRLVAGASVLAGATGSALHQAVFCRPGTQVVEVGDARTPTVPQSSQVMVDAALGHRSTFVPYADPDRLGVVLTDI